MQAEQLELPRDHTIPAVNATQLLPYRALLSQYCYNSLINFKFAKTAVNQVGTTDRVTADTPFIGELENNENFPLTDRGLTLPTIVTLVLLTVLAALVAGASPAFAQGTVPEAPDQPIGTAVFVGGVDLEWNDVPGADSYDVQLYRNGQWLDLPGDGVEIAFYGAGAIISGLDPNSTLWFQVRAKNAQGFSDWSNVSSMASTNQFRLGRRARSANVPASGTPVINGTAQVGESLTADTTGIEDGNGLDRVQFRFQWVSHDGSADTAIAGATDSTYTLAASDEGKTIKVRVAFTDRGGYAESLTSAATATVAAVPNSPATGAPVISGTAEVGKTLTADTSDIADADGLSGATYSYQWVANNGTSDTDITGGTDSTYTLVAADEGKIIKVKVSFTDDAGNGETLTSAVTAEVAARPNSPATGAPTISGTTQVGEALTADTSGIGDADGLTNVSYSHQWIRNDGSSDTSITDATDSTYTLVDADEGKTIKVRVSFTDDADNEETLTSAATSSVAARPNNPATGGPTISGTAQVGETLTANTSGIADTDGLTNVSYSHRWIRNDGTSDAGIENATGSSYTLVDADEGQTIKVEVSFTDDAGYDETLTSAATAAVEARPNSAATGAPAISGTAQVGETLTADTSGIADDDGLNNVSYSYQWIANDGTADTDIQDATGPTYTLVSADEGKTIKVRVSFTDDAGTDETLTSTETEAVSFAVQQQVANNLATGAPFISGTTREDRNLWADTLGIADADGLTRVSYSYQWIRNDGTSDTDITDATESWYFLVSDDVGQTIKVKVTFTDDAGNQESLTSEATGKVAPARPRGYMTVVVTGTNSTVTWNDSGDCSTDYNIYKRSSRDSGGDVPRTHLGFATSGSSEATVAISESSSGSYRTHSVTLELYCGTYDSDSSNNELVASTEVPIREGTYSWASLTALTVSPGTLTPDFDRGGKKGARYTVEVPSDVEVITLYTTVLNAYQTDFIKDPGWGIARVCGGEYDDCQYTYGGVTLSDADPDKEGFQINLDRGENRLGIGVNLGSLNVESLGRVYNLTVTVQSALATGTPTISGTAQVGETLTADTSGIADVDGLTNISYSYQWIRNDGTSDTDIAGATDATYTLVAADVGKTIKVRVTFTDAAGNDESLTSEATGAVATNGAPTGTVEVGETLTADTSGIEDGDGLDNVFFSYQWIRTDGTTDLDVGGATSATYTISATDVGHAIKVRVGYTDDAGNVESLTSAATVTVPLEVTFAFNIEGTTVNCDSWNVHVVNVPYKECDDPISTDQGANGEIDVEIEIARSVSSQLYKFDFHIYQVEDSLGHYSTVEANDLCLGPGLAESALLEVTPDDGTGSFTYTDDGTIFGLCAAGTFQLVVRWYRYDYTAEEFEPAGTFRRYFFITSNEEVDTSIEKVKWITALYPEPPISHGDVQIEATKESEALNRGLATYSLSIGGLVPDSDPETTDYVVRLGVIGEWDGEVREVPWCHVGNVGYSYLLKTVPEDGQWAMEAHVLGSCIQNWPDTLQVELFDGPDLTNYSEPIVLDGSHIISYTGELMYPEYGTHEFIAGKDIVFRPQPTIPEPTIPETRGPTISGTAQVGETLTVDTSGMVGTDGEYNVSFSYQWIAIDGTAKTNIVGATDSTYTLVADDAGKTIIVRVNRLSLTDDGVYVWILDSTATEVVTFAVQQQVANNPATGTLAISGTVQVGETLTVDTSGISDADGLDNVAYSYQWLSSRDTEISGATNDSYALVSDDEGKAIKVKVAFTDDAGNQEMLTSAPTAVVSAPAQVDYENEPSELSHLTVVVTEDDSDPDNVVSTFTITWNDAEDCSASYNAYLDGVVGDPIHLGSAASEGDQIAGSLTNVSAETFGFNANLHCGTIGSGRLVDRLWIPEYNRSIGTLPISRAYLPKPGTYSTEPGLIALTVSSGTLTPAFHNQTLNYTVPDVPNADGRFTVTTTAKADYYNVAFIPGSYYTFFSVCSYGGQQTSLSYGDDAGNRIYPLTDADANAPGFQMDLDEGENVFYIRVWPNCETGQLYKLTVTRAASAPANTPATGAPTIGGTARVGQPLTADTTGIADSDGLENATFAYQWLADDTKIDGATHSTYTLVVADEGQTIKVEVSFTDDADNEETLTSTATAEVAAAAPTDPPGAPRNLTGIANSDGTVTLRWDAPNDDSVSGYQILRRRPREGENTLLVLVNDTGSTDTEYTDNDVTPDVGHAYRVKAINAVGLGRQSKFVNVTPTQPAGPAQNNPATGTPTISGTAQVGETLTADTSGIGDDDGLANVTFSYQWIASDEAVDIDITSATVSSYTLVDADEGQTIQVQVSFTDDAGNDESLTSAATAPVPARPNTPATGAPTIGGTAQVGETLAADTSGIADTDGLTNVTYSYQWLGDDTGIAGATSSTYTLAETDEGKTIKVRVSFTDDRGNLETGTSAATAVVAVPDPPAKPTGLSAVVSHDTVTLTWDDPQDDSITGYVILRRDREIHPTGTFVTIAGDTGSADTTYTDETVEPDKQYVYRIEAINEHGKVSEISDWVRADTPAAPVPDKPTGLSAVVSHDTVTLTWDDPQDDTITGYVILRRDREIHPTGTFVTIAGDTGSADTTYTDDTVEPDKEYVYRIKAINEHGEVSEISHWLRTDTPNWATGAPTIGGNAQVGETLTAGISEIADDDGLENAVFSYQWVASSGTTDTNIAAATDSTYDLVAADAGKTIKVRVSFTDDAGNEETLTSTATNTVSLVSGFV